MVQLFQKEAILCIVFMYQVTLKEKKKVFMYVTLDETKNELHLNKHIPTEDFPSYVIKKMIIFMYL